MNSWIRASISGREISNKRCVPNFSTQKEANAEPAMMARFMFSKDASSEAAMNPMKPQANVSPAPVGSNTSSKGNAGAKNTFSP